MTNCKNLSSDEKSSSTITMEDFNSKTTLTERPPPQDKYNPFDHRDQINGTSTFGTMAHLLKCSLGGGILAMPLAFKNAGLLFGLIGSILSGILCTHCVHILVKTSHKVCRDAKVPSLGFAATAEKVFEHGPKQLRPWSNFAKQFVDSAIMATFFAATCVYILFVAQSFHDVINHDFNINWDLRIYIGLTVVPLLLISQIRILKRLVPFSALANAFIVVTFAITLYYMFSGELTYSDKPLMANVAQIPSFFATAIFAMEGIGAVMPIENAMKRPQKFLGKTGVLNIVMFFVVFLYSVIGFFGYVRYGDEVLGSITLNLERGSLVADAAKILMGLAILFTSGVQIYVPFEILWRKIKDGISEENHNISQIIMRAVSVLICGIVAAAVPNLEAFLGLVGAVFLSVLGIFIPSFLEIIILWPSNFGYANWKLYKNVLLGIFCLFALTSGSYISIKEIWKIYGA